ncbi:MAG: hypothetical protein ACE5EX_00020 [Phycisphaerae bacterium]
MHKTFKHTVGVAGTSGLIAAISILGAGSVWAQYTASESAELPAAAAAVGGMYGHTASADRAVSPLREGGAIADDLAVVGDAFERDGGTGSDPAYVVDSSPVEGPTLIPISQLRLTNTVVDFPQCNPVSSGDQAVGFGPFDSAVQAALNCAGPYSDMSASQQSQIDVTSMTAAGGLFFKTTGFEGNPVSLVTGADSVFEVTFELPSAQSFILSGIISADGFGPAAALGTHAGVTLTGPGAQTIFTHLVSVAPDGTPGFENVGDAGQLKPGMYTLHAEVGAGIDGILPSSGVGSAAFDFTFDVLEPTAPVPAVSQWAMLTMVLLFLTVGTLMFGLRRYRETALT